MIMNQKMTNIEEGIKMVDKMYLQFGFNITCIHSDIDFEPLQSEVADLGNTLNCMCKKEHVLKIGWLIRNIKEGVQYTGSTIPFVLNSK